ncbi:MAG: hypothetical protein K8F92_03045 [Hyphomicrobium sp.]|uniref:hypothetical protein n=1 Tax=Hyphomicrobium sp. TaxID=82 RepID=UPI001322624B|nr:hypothetical protein [Hyphomicrobium sp.]KAB2942633.1 MAG: hypothetical protein F9K20_06525 [Hyphomicrobium sp.]MBZ0208618.1 hypothetical protein [Hyphomicrobium sp.]
MRLTTATLERTIRKFDAQPIPEEHPLVEKLNSMFGDHTYLLGSSGLHIVEPTGRAQSQANKATVIKVASWEDASRTRLQPHEPELTDVIVDLDEPGPAD